MGLNYVRRPPRERFDPPSDYIAAVMGEKSFGQAHMFLEDVVLEQADAALTAALDRVRKISFGGAVRDPR